MSLQAGYGWMPDPPVAKRLALRCMSFQRFNPDVRLESQPCVDCILCTNSDSLLVRSFAS